jgi:hypothetical protein
MKFEVFDKERISRKFRDNVAHTAEYQKHIGYGASGTYNDKTKVGEISSFLKQAKKLEKHGYKNLKFCNGGDNDHLIADHEAKEFGFFEYFLHSHLDSAANLTDLWNKSP